MCIKISIQLGGNILTHYEKTYKTREFFPLPSLTRKGDPAKREEALTISIKT